MSLFRGLLYLCGAYVIMGTGCHSRSEDLFQAIRAKDVRQVERLLAAGNIDLDPPSGFHEVNKPLAYAAAYGNLEVVKLLVEAGADLNGRVAYWDVPLVKADEHGNEEVVKYLIEAGADVNVPNAYGNTPFIGLCGRGKLELVRLAAKHGGDPNARFKAVVGKSAGKENWSAFEAAVTFGRKEVVEFLLTQGADPLLTRRGGQTPLQLAESRGHREVARILRAHIERRFRGHSVENAVRGE